MKNSPKRIGIAYSPDCIGLSLIISWNNFYDGYDFTTRSSYVDIRFFILFYNIWFQIPYKKMGIKGVIK